MPRQTDREAVSCRHRQDRIVHEMQPDEQVPLRFIRLKTTIHEISDHRGEGFQALGLSCHFWIVARGNKPFSILFHFENQFVHSTRLQGPFRPIKHSGGPSAAKSSESFSEQLRAAEAVD